MKLRYDKKVDALRITLSSNPIEDSDEVKDGIIVDYDEKGKVVAIEILDVSDRVTNPSRFNLDIAS